jgi:hypothetical protein
VAAGDTKVTICNQALNLLGADTITSFSDTSNDAAAVCNNIYDTVKNMALSMYPWSFALAKKELSQSSTTPINEWQYRYDLPGDNLTGNVFQLYNSSSTAILPVNRFEIVYTDSGPAINTDEPTIFIDYISSNISEGMMPAYFIQLLVYMMTWHLAEPVTDQITKAQYWEQVTLGTAAENGRGGYLRQAMNADGRGKSNYAINDFPLTDVRA